MAARLQLNPTPVVQRRDILFTGDYVRAAWSLHPVGDRIVVTRPANAPTALEGADSGAERFVVVVNWFES